MQRSLRIALVINCLEFFLVKLVNDAFQSVLYEWKIEVH